MNVVTGNQDRREGPRIDAYLPTRILKINDQSLDQGRSYINLSITGIRFTTDESFDVGTAVEVEVYDFDEMPIPMSAVGSVVRCEPDNQYGKRHQVAVKFISIHDTDRTRIESFTSRQIKQ